MVINPHFVNYTIEILLLYQNNRVFALISVVVNDLRAATSCARISGYLRVQGAPSPSNDPHYVALNTRLGTSFNWNAVPHRQVRYLTTTAGGEGNKSTGEFVCHEGSVLSSFGDQISHQTS